MAHLAHMVEPALGSYSGLADMNDIYLLLKEL